MPSSDFRDLTKFMNGFSDTLPDLAETVNHPAHYNTGTIEVIDFIEDFLTREEFEGFLKGNIVKYITRCRYKGNDRKDKEKAEWYLKRLLKLKETK